MAATQPPHSWLPEALTRAALATGVGYVAAAYTVSRWLTRPTRGRPEATPARLGWPWQPLDCRTRDGIRLVGWVVEPPRARATVALFHGMRHNRGQMLERTALLAEAGYRCVAFDHRAHGESGGRRTSFGFHEARDAAAVRELVRKRWPRQPAAALGFSMGAAALCFGAEQAGAWDAVVLESCYADLASAFTSRLRHGYPPVYQRLSKGVVWVTERRLGVRLPNLAPADHVGRLGATPVLVLTGNDDVHAPPDAARHLYDRCRGPRELLLVPGARHRDVVETGGPLYCEQVRGFLDRQLAA